MGFRSARQAHAACLEVVETDRRARNKWERLDPPASWPQSVEQLKPWKYADYLARQAFQSQLPTWICDNFDGKGCRALSIEMKIVGGQLVDAEDLSLKTDQGPAPE